MGIPSGAKDFKVHDVDTTNGETCDIFKNPIVCCFIFCNIFYNIMEILSLIHGRKGWSNHVKASCICA